MMRFILFEDCMKAAFNQSFNKIKPLFLNKADLRSVISNNKHSSN